jgi:hypothetical protein
MQELKMRRLNLLMAVCAGITLAACDRDSPVQPHSPNLAELSRDAASASGLSASAISPSEIDLVWPGSSAPANGYQVSRSTTGATGTYSIVATTAPAATGYADLGLTGSTTYCYEVRSFKTTGKNTTYSAYSASACATTLNPPIIPPSGVDVVPLPNGWFVDQFNSLVRVSWTDNSANEDGFRVEHASVPTGPWTTGPWPESVTTPPNVTLLNQSGEREKQICFRVIAFNATGVSNASSADCTTPPANPTNLVAKAADGQSINLTWKDNSAVEDGYEVSRLDAAGTWADLAVLPPNAVSYRDAGVMVDRTYTYRVQALKDGGFSDYTNESVAVIPTAPPAAPSGAYASFWSDHDYGWRYLDIAWTDASNNEEGFRIEFSADGVSGWQTSYTAGVNATGLQDKQDLWGTLGRIACYRVLAFNGAGTSAPSNVACAEWADAPSNLTATAVDQQSIDLSWTDNGTYEVGYVVFRSTDIGGPYDVVGSEAGANATSFRDTGLASGQQYWYFVAADFGGYSFYDSFNYSDYASATTPSATLSARLSAPGPRTIIKAHLTPVRIRGRLTLEEIRARFRTAPIRSTRPSRHRR